MESLLIEALLPSDEEQVRGGQKFNQAATKALLGMGGSKPGLNGYTFAQTINPAILFDIPGGTVIIGTDVEIDAREGVDLGVKANLPDLAKP